jgi:predicted component of type VI protein secretion system
MKWALVVDRGGHKGKVIPIRISPLAIGRDDDCQLRTSNLYVSHRHCELLTQDDKIILRDCNSTNGTFLNDQRIDKDAELHEGDRLKIGPMAFVVHQTNDADQAHGQPSESLQPIDSAPGPKRAVDEDAVGEMLLEMDEKAQQERAPHGSWRKPSAEEFRNSPDAPASRNQDRPREKESEPPTAKVASRMLKGKGDWLKRKSTDDDP